MERARERVSIFRCEITQKSRYNSQIQFTDDLRNKGDLLTDEMKAALELQEDWENLSDYLITLNVSGVQYEDCELYMNPESTIRYLETQQPRGILLSWIWWFENERYTLSPFETKPELYNVFSDILVMPLWSHGEFNKDTYEEELKEEMGGEMRLNPSVALNYMYENRYKK